MAPRIFPSFFEMMCCTAAALEMSGCGFHNPNGPGSYHAAVNAAKNSEQALEAAGAKLTRKQYPLGSAWVVDLSKADIIDQTFELLGKLDRIAELNLSGSTINDELMSHFNGSEIGGVLTNLDLSNTEVTDAAFDDMKELLFLTELNVTDTKITAEAIDQWQRARLADERVNQNFKKVKVRR